MLGRYYFISGIRGKNPGPLKRFMTGGKTEALTPILVGMPGDAPRVHREGGVTVIYTHESYVQNKKPLKSLISGAFHIYGGEIGI